MKDNKIMCKYVEEVNPKAVDAIEKYFNVLLPSDYKVSLSLINQGKPINDRLDIGGRVECVVDYFIDIDLVISVSNNINQHDFIAIASDPFGNYYGFLKQNN